MSSTNRGSRRSPADFYPTPAWCVRRLLDEVVLPGGGWVEPCAGDGAIVRAVSAVRDDVVWTCNEVRATCEEPLRGLGATVRIGETQGWRPDERAAVAITNPPFRLAMDMVAWSRRHADVAVLLLRLNFVATARRAPFMRAHPPDVYVLPNRPSFTGRGTDSIEYAWFVWGQGGGRLRVLAPTPVAERRAAKLKA